MNADVITMTIALVVMAMAIVAKIVIIRLLAHMQHSIDMVHRTLQGAHHDFGVARAKKDIALKKITSLKHKKTRVQKKISQLRSKLKSLRKEEAQRRQMRATARGIVTGPSEDVPGAVTDISEEV